MEGSRVKKQSIVVLDEVEKIVKRLIEENNKEFERKLEVNQLLIDSLMRENERKETLLEGQKGKSSCYRAKTNQSKKWMGHKVQENHKKVS